VESKKLIPDAWRQSVVRILRAGDEKCIEWTKQALLDWRAATLSQFRFEAYEAMADGLSVDDAVGVEVDLPEDGETFAFFFPYEQRILYGKICLRTSKLRIKIVSTHTPRKGDKLF
jgi:hypothetical protein